ncbi:hypothetical protein CLOSCI_01709 [[Clostridium] scindens ATCC 35704]|nr:hypothetical protein CLOSCI_01709 [[Clostridium] scindens ATCC 35704]
MGEVLGDGFGCGRQGGFPFRLPSPGKYKQKGPEMRNGHVAGNGLK